MNTAIKAIRLEFQKELQALYSVDEVDAVFYLCLEHVLGLERHEVLIERFIEITSSQNKEIQSCLSRLKAHEPIQYIFEKAHFFGLNLKVNKHVLIPRQETEELIDKIIKQASNLPTVRILDIGTGSGCIAIALAQHLDKAQVYALDISAQALDVASENATRNNTSVHFFKADILNPEEWEKMIKDLKFDIIVSNPPYVRHLEKSEIQPNVLDFEPHLALFVSDKDPLKFYKAIVTFAENHLKSNGQLYFEINQYLGEATLNLLQNEAFQNSKIIKDINANDRFISATKQQI